MSNADSLVKNYKNIIKRVPKNMRVSQWEDIIHNAYIRLSQCKSSNIINKEAYTEVAIRHAHYNSLRGKKLINPFVDFYSLRDVRSVEEYKDSLYSASQVDKLNELIEDLPPKRKQIMKLFLKGFSIKDIAKELNSDYNATKTQYRLACIYLKSHRKDFPC